MAIRKSAAENNTCFVDKVSRTIYISGDITHPVASKFRRLFNALERTDGGIVVEINTPGGSIEAGFLIMDTIMLSERMVTTRATGITMSMGSMILLAGDHREALPLATIMVHQGSFVIRAKAEDMANEMAEAQRLEDLCWTLMDGRTEKAPGYWKTFCGGKDKFLDAATALRENLIERICG